MKRKLYQFAKNNCCNYYGTFNGKQDYCSYEGKCALKDGGTCSWFERAVLPLDLLLYEQYYRQLELVAQKKGRKPIVKRRCKLCKKPVPGKRRYCDDCKVKMRRRTYCRSKQRTRATATKQLLTLHSLTVCPHFFIGYGSSINHLQREMLQVRVKVSALALKCILWTVRELARFLSSVP